MASVTTARLIFIVLFCFIQASAIGQNYGKYWVFFKDKSTEPFDPYSYFDGKAIERRVKHGIPLVDFSDLPVKKEYIEQVAGIADSTGHITRWFNGMIFFSNEERAEIIAKLPFVSTIKEAGNATTQLAAQSDSSEFFLKLTDKQKKLLTNQLSAMGAEHFENNNFDGKGIRIAVFDAGFPGVDKNPVFKHLIKEKRIVGTFDFVRKRENVFSSNNHGTMVLSCIAGMVGGRKIGMATGAEFLLARTEKANFEPFSEEENWLAAAEWADKNGAHIINSSLGYTYHRYFTHQMDGTSFIAKAANMAASKGILVVNAAGNDGSGKWKIIGTPGDADSVLTVGGINHSTQLHVNFSSFGPTSAKKLKPNVSAYGIVIAANAEGLTQTQGTSFSSPLVAGFAACALQAKPDLKNMELFSEIEKSGNLFPYFDYAHGYGIPQAAYFTESKTNNNEPTFEIIKDEALVKVIIKQGYLTEENKIREADRTFFPGEHSLQEKHYLYYHIENNFGNLDKYLVLQVLQPEVLSLPTNSFKKGEILRVHFRGYTQSIKF
jgi:serine protease AprX